MTNPPETTAVEKPSNDPAKSEEFVGRVIGDVASTFTMVALGIGDRFGLFKELAARGPQTSGELAGRADLAERYVREWASLLTTAGYLTYDPSSRRFAMPPDHAPVLAEEGGPFFVGGIFQQMPALLGLYEPLARAFKDGKGIDPSLYTEDVWKGEQRGNDMWHNHLLVDDWIPRMPAVQEKLRAGARVADIGSGSGRALVRLAQAFPNSTFVGFDIEPDSVKRAQGLAEAEGVADRVSFQVHDLTQGLPAEFDIVTAFDVVHDTADPLGVVKHVRGALKPGGTFVLLEINSADKLEDNEAPFGTVFYGYSLLFCMSIAIARGGQGLGTAGLPHALVREYAKAAGFAEVRRIDIENPINVLYEVKT